MHFTSILLSFVSASLLLANVDCAPVAGSSNTDITKPFADVLLEALVSDTWDDNSISGTKGIKAHVLGTKKEKSTGGKHVTSAWFPANPFNQNAYSSLVEGGYDLNTNIDKNTFLAQVPFRIDVRVKSPTPQKPQARQSGAPTKPKVPEVSTKTLFMDANSPEAAFKGSWKDTDIEDVCKAAMRASIVASRLTGLQLSAGSSAAPTGFSVPTPFGRNICVRLIGTVQVTNDVETAKISSCFPLSIHETTAETGASCTDQSAFDKLFLQRQPNVGADADGGKQTNGPSDAAQGSVAAAPASSPKQGTVSQNGAPNSSSSTGSGEVSGGAASTSATPPPKVISPVKPPAQGAPSSSSDTKVLPVAAVPASKPGAPTHNAGSSASTGSAEVSDGSASTSATQPPKVASRPVKPPVPGAASPSSNDKVPTVVAKPAKPPPKASPKPAAKAPAQGGPSLGGSAKAPPKAAKPAIKPAKPASKPKSAKARSKIVKVRRGAGKLVA